MIMKMMITNIMMIMVMLLLLSIMMTMKMMMMVMVMVMMMIILCDNEDDDNDDYECDDDHYVHDDGKFYDNDDGNDNASLQLLSLLLSCSIGLHSLTMHTVKFSFETLSYLQPSSIANIVKPFSLSVVGATFPNPTLVSMVNVK